MARDGRIDTLKGLLIILVVLGHLITTIDNVNVINHAVMGGIYIFHMPLFIFISGYLTRDPREQPASRMWNGVKTIALALAIFQVIRCSVNIAMGGNPVATLLAFPFGELWYLLCLIYWRVLFYYTPARLIDKPALHIGLAVLAAILVGLIPLNNALALSRGINFYMYFLLGYYWRQGKLKPALWRNSIVQIAIVAVLLPAIFILFPRCGNMLNGADQYGIQDIPQKVMIMLCSVSMSLLVFRSVREHRIMSHVGRESLFIYLYHYLVIRLAIVPMTERFGLGHTMPWMLIYLAIVVGILLLLSKVKPLRWLTKPTLKRAKQALT